MLLQFVLKSVLNTVKQKMTWNTSDCSVLSYYKIQLFSYFFYLMPCRCEESYLHLQRQLVPGVVVVLVLAGEVVTVAVRVHDAGLHQAALRAQCRQVLTAGEGVVAKGRLVVVVPVLRLRGQQQGRRVRLGLAGGVLGGQMEQRVLEGQGEVHGGRGLLLLLGDGFRGAPDVAHLAQPQAGAGPHAQGAAQVAEAVAQAGNGCLGGGQHVPHRVQVGDAVHARVLEVHHGHTLVHTVHLRKNKH